MPAILPDFEYDIFISYRQKDNKRDGWVTEFVNTLKAELEATLKNPVSIYFDENPHDGLLETHLVDASLAKKLKCIVFIPIISQTYCDTSSFAWQHELLAFIRMASSDPLGMNVTLANGNVSSRILPIQIHDLDADDRLAIESALAGPLRAISFTYSSPGVNRPLRMHEEHAGDNKNRVVYRDQINKVANALKEIGTAVVRQEKKRGGVVSPGSFVTKPAGEASEKTRSFLKILSIAAALVLILILGYYASRFITPTVDASKVSIGVIPFRNNTGDPSMSHYGVGIASEVSTQLGSTRQFDFISSLQATIQYQQSDKAPETIGQELGVTHILTGMYQTAGDNMQVLVELVDATGKVVWSIPYRTHYKDIFEVQASIAARVMDKFSVRDAADPHAATPNLEAYAHYIRGLEMVLKSNIPEDRMKAIPEFQKSIALDSSVIGPWAGIVEQYCYYYFNRGRTSSLTLEMIIPYITYIEDQFPDTWEKKLIQGTYAYWALMEYDKGLALFLETLKEVPKDPAAHSMAAAIYRRKLDLKEAFYHVSLALKQNPAAPIFWNDLVPILALNGDYENAIKAASTQYQLNELLFLNLYRLRRAQGTLEQLPDHVKLERGNMYSADLFLQKRDFRGLLVFLDSLKPDSSFTPGHKFYYQAMAQHLLKQDREARQNAERATREKGLDVLGKAGMFALLGNEKEFMELAIDHSGVSLSQDLSVQFADQTSLIRYYAFSGNYAKADEMLKQVNRNFPQVGDYVWLNMPTYDRIKEEYPPFLETINQLKLPPRIMDTQLIRM